MGVIYKITSPSNKVYVGKTYNLKQRIACHKYSAKQGKNIILQHSIRKYGWDAHVLEVIEELPDDTLNEREMYWIVKLKTYSFENEDGMNMTLGGEGQRSTWMHKTELRAWFSDKFSGEGNPFYGKTHTDEVKALLSKKTKEYNLMKGWRIPEWGAEKGRQKVIKPVVVYNQGGDLISEYESLSECAKQLGVNAGTVSSSVRRGSWINGLYLAKFKIGGSPLKIIVGKIKLQTVRRPIFYFFNSFIIEYPSALEASMELGIPKTSISRAALYNKMKPIRTGHIFIYKDLFKQPA